MSGLKGLRCAVLLMCTTGAAMVSVQPAAATMYNENALAAAGVISKSQAIAIALKAVGGGHVISAVFETEDHLSHWTVDIIGGAYEYEVWVAASGSIQRIITQPK